MVSVLSLCFTLALAWLLTQMAPSPATLLFCRVSLLSCLGISAVAVIAVPVVRLSPMVVARKVEKRFPQFSQRLVTLTESPRNRAIVPFYDLIAEDTLGIARGATPEQLVGGVKMAGVAAMGIGAGFVLLWLALWPRGAVGREAQALWTGSSDFSVELKPVRKTVLRGSAVTVSAHVSGFPAKAVELLVRYAGSRSWQKISMLPGSDASEFVFRFDRLPASAELYATAQGIESPVSAIRTINLPRVENIEAFYAQQRKQSGDIVAPIGTVATLRIETDRPLNAAELVVEPGDSLPLAPTSNNTTSASLSVMRDAAYHVSVRYEGELVQVSGEYEIEVPMADKSRPRPAAPVNVRTGPIPPGYETAVAAYYKRLSEAQGGQHQ